MPYGFNVRIQVTSGCSALTANVRFRPKADVYAWKKRCPLRAISGHRALLTPTGRTSRFQCPDSGDKWLLYAGGEGPKVTDSANSPIRAYS